ncbi:multidrug efflux RND transporter periplasmic adaptor subunit VmeE [Endothiovibrio diazotrophicus]
MAVTRTTRLDLTPTTRLTGQLQPARSAQLQFEVGGRVTERLVEPGQRVVAGAPLARLDGADYRDALAEAQARLAEERLAVARDRRLLALAGEHRKLQQREVERLERLGEQSLASHTNLDEARQRLLQLQGDEARLRQSVDGTEPRLTLSRTAVERARRNVRRTTLTAPFAGTVNRVNFEVGDSVTSSQPALTLVETDRLDLYLEAGGESARVLELGRPLTVTVGSERRDGEVVALQRDPEPTTHTHPLRIRLDGQGLLPGQLARAELPLAPLHGVIAVPVSAVLREEGRAYLYRIGAENRLERREVELGPRYQERQVILTGIDADQPIAARDVAALSPDQKVVPVSDQ